LIEGNVNFGKAVAADATIVNVVIDADIRPKPGLLFERIIFSAAIALDSRSLEAGGDILRDNHHALPCVGK
jgi:hypothetical protein